LLTRIRDDEAEVRKKLEHAEKESLTLLLANAEVE